MYAIYGIIYHQYTPFMLAYIPAPWIIPSHPIWGAKLVEASGLGPKCLVAKETQTEQSSWGRRIRSNDVKCHIFLCKKCEKPLESDESWFQEDFTPVLSSWPMRTEAFPKPQGRQLERILPNSPAWQLARARWHLMHPICVPDCHPSPG